jgi:hypothetical protein
MQPYEAEDMVACRSESRYRAVEGQCLRASGIQVLNQASVPGTGHQGTRSINIIHTLETPWAHYETSGLTVMSYYCNVFLTVIHGNALHSFLDIVFPVINYENEESAFH